MGKEIFIRWSWHGWKNVYVWGSFNVHCLYYNLFGPKRAKIRAWVPTSRTVFINQYDIFASQGFPIHYVYEKSSVSETLASEDVSIIEVFDFILIWIDFWGVTHETSRSIHVLVCLECSHLLSILFRLIHVHVYILYIYDITSHWIANTIVKLAKKVLTYKAKILEILRNNQVRFQNDFIF